MEEREVAPPPAEDDVPAEPTVGQERGVGLGDRRFLLVVPTFIGVTIFTLTPLAVLG